MAASNKRKLNRRDLPTTYKSRTMSPRNLLVIFQTLAQEGLNWIAISRFQLVRIFAYPFS